MQSIIISGKFQLIFTSLAFHKFFVTRHLVAYMTREETGYAPGTVFVCTGYGITPMLDHHMCLRVFGYQYADSAIG